MGQPVKARPRIWFRIAQIFRPARPEPACLDEVAALRSDRSRLIVNRIERILGISLYGFVLTVPGSAASVRLTRRISEYLRHGQDRLAPECWTRIQIRAGAGSSTARTINHVTDLREIDLHAANRCGRSDFVSSEGGVAEVHVQRRRQHLCLEHRI